jgi:hypothetical protein
MKVANAPTNNLGPGFTIHILLSKWDMIHKFMHKKFDFSIKGCDILFTHHHFHIV